MRSKLLDTCAAGAVLIGAAMAQSGGTPDTTPAQVEEQIARTQRTFAESESRLQRLQELRLRLAFGLPIDAERYFSISPDERDLVRENGSERLVTEEAELERLSLHANELSDQVDRRRHATRTPAAPAGDMLWPADPVRNGVTKRIDVPRLGGEAKPGAGAETSAPKAAHRDPGLMARVGDGAGAAAEVPQASRPFAATHDGANAAAVQKREVVEMPEPVEPSHIIAGSKQHGAVGRVLLRSGENLLREAAKTVDAGRMKALRERAQKMFAQAKRELEPLSKVDIPELIDLYHLARCEEKLGNGAAADSLYAQIISRDQVVSEEGVETYGRWGKAAQAAKSVLRWVEDRGGWKPTQDIEAIRW